MLPVRQMICGDKEQLAIAKKEAEVMVRVVPPSHTVQRLWLSRIAFCDSCVIRAVEWQRLLSPHPNIVQLHAVQQKKGPGGETEAQSLP